MLGTGLLQWQGPLRGFFVLFFNDSDSGITSALPLIIELRASSSSLNCLCLSYLVCITEKKISILLTFFSAIIKI